MMRLKLLSLGLGFCLSTSVFASNQHSHVPTESANRPAKVSSMTWAGSCEIEIVNQSYSDVRVFGSFDDSTMLEPFNIYSFEQPHYISLYYDWFCHDGMTLDIDAFNGAHIFGGYVYRGTTVRIVPYLASQVRAEIRKS